VRALKRHSDKIVVNFDPDAAGSNAAERSVQMLLEEGLRVRVLVLEGGLDPDEFVKQSGAVRYREVLEKAPGYFHWLAGRARARFDMHSAQGRVSALQALLPAIQHVGDKLERAAIAAEVAGLLGVETGLVLDHFKKAAAGRIERPIESAGPALRAVEKILLNSLLLRKEIRGDIIPQLRSMPQISHFGAARVFQSLFALYDRQPDFRLADLEARLEESDRRLFATAVFADEIAEEGYTLEQAQACLRRLEQEDRESQRTTLRMRVKEAERAGDLPEALRLAEELSQLRDVRS
jgi:DNA primase